VKVVNLWCDTCKKRTVHVMIYTRDNDVKSTCQEHIIKLSEV